MNRIRDRPACSAMHQPTTLIFIPFMLFVLSNTWSFLTEGVEVTALRLSKVYSIVLFYEASPIRES